MKVLILGGGGMLGHMLWRKFPVWCECAVTVRAPASAYERFACLPRIQVFDGVDAMDERSVSGAIRQYGPDVVVNCIGIVKQSAVAKDPLPCIKVNAFLPHLAQAVCADVGARFIHVSTDCVFSGRKGGYTLEDIPDPLDLYGRSKLLGEVHAAGAVTLRTSMIGRELSSQQGLVEWFLSERGHEVKGFRKALFSGFTTLALSRILEAIIRDKPELDGLWQVAADPIDKYALLSLIDEVYGTGTTIVADDRFVCDRSLDGSAFLGQTGLAPPTWREMIEDMYKDEIKGGYGDA
jgi:dTDP-4-dehydrorhamnose reductase